MRLGTFWTFLFIIFGCTSGKVFSTSIPQNPISYVFKADADSARFLFAKSYWTFHNGLQFDLKEMAYHGDNKERIWSESAKLALAGDVNKNDVWMVVSVDSSSVYRDKDDKALPYLMECKAHFEPVGNNQTRMEIQVRSAKVMVGKKALPSAPHFVNHKILKEVRPTTVEEYKLLLCFANGLGVRKQMPPLKKS